MYWCLWWCECRTVVSCKLLGQWQRTHVLRALSLSAEQYMTDCHWMNVVRVVEMRQQCSEHSVYVCWSLPWAVLKRMNRSSSRSLCRLLETQGTMYWVGTWMPHGKGHYRGGHAWACPSSTAFSIWQERCGICSNLSVELTTCVVRWYGSKAAWSSSTWLAWRKTRCHFAISTGPTQIVTCIIFLRQASSCHIFILDVDRQS